jgi:hypothetical protein
MSFHSHGDSGRGQAESARFPSVRIQYRLSSAGFTIRVSFGHEAACEGPQCTVRPQDDRVPRHGVCAGAGASSARHTSTACTESPARQGLSAAWATPTTTRRPNRPSACTRPRSFTGTRRQWAAAKGFHHARQVRGPSEIPRSPPSSDAPADAAAPRVQFPASFAACQRRPSWVC